MTTKSNIVVLTGAGISAESGIKTFRDNNGLWENHRVEDVASPEGYSKNPTLVRKFYNLRRNHLLSDEVAPNIAHNALGEFEKNYSGNFLLVTQNVDNLHERGGSKNILHMHGELTKMRCSDCGEIFKITEDLSPSLVCSNCNKQGKLRPHIVWFGEMPLYMDKIYYALERADYFISIGTSALVYPAAMFVDAVNINCKKIELNLEKTTKSSCFNESIQGKASEIVPKFFESLLKL